MDAAKLLVITVFSVLLATPVFAAEIEKYSILATETRIAADGKAVTSLIVSLDRPAGSEVLVPFRQRPLEWSADANFEPFSCSEAENENYGFTLSCDISAIKDRRGSFKVEYQTLNAPVKAGSSYSFEEEIMVPLPFTWKTATSKIVMPEGTALAGLPSPSYGSNSTDGRSIFVLWVRESVRGGEIIKNGLSYEKFGGDVNVSAFYGIIALLAVLAAVGFVYSRKINPKMVLPVLRRDEKIIMEKLLAHGGKAHQKVLVRESLYSKAKVSKVLKSLAERGVVTLERVGRSNQVFLSSNFGKKEQNTSGNSPEAQNTPE